MSKKIFITAIDTNIGKTQLSAILCRALHADYWKPVQCGELDNSDTIKVKRLAGHFKGRVHPEAYAFKHAVSPHSAAQKEGVQISLNEIHLPPTNNTLVIEGAGGVLVPLNFSETILDLIVHCEAETLVVSKNYLGSINHTLLTLEVLKQRGIKIIGVVMIGAENTISEQAITALSGVPVIAHINWSNQPDVGFTEQEAERLQPVFEKLITG